MAKILMKGNEAIAQAAVSAGCEAFFGYPITPQNELIEYMAKYLAKNDGVFVQAESELAAINMIYGAAGAGARVMTSSSSPGIALKQEGISYCAGAELPVVIVSVSRGGPGLGGILPSQADYNQATRGGGNGDYKVMVLAPNGVQEATELVRKAFELAEKYRNPVMVMVDGIIGQMMEPVEINPTRLPDVDRPWAAEGQRGRAHRNVVNSMNLDAYKLEQHNRDLQAKYDRMEREDVMFETVQTEDAEVLLVAYGTPSRIVKSAIATLREQGIKAGLFRPQTLLPFPSQALKQAAQGKQFVLVAELSLGQMLVDVKLALEGTVPVHFYGRTGGVIFEPSEIVDAVKSHWKGD
jgi:2-oxoglutarate/2-oxoacid ferredoxin oxidoreductase subunit alpha